MEMRKKFPREFSEDTDIAYNPSTGRIDLIKDENKTANKDEN